MLINAAENGNLTAYVKFAFDERTACGYILRLRNCSACSSGEIPSRPV
jgi:hypothetical protein